MQTYNPKTPMSLNTLSLIFLFGICSGQNHLTRNIPSSSISIVSSSSIIGSSSGGGSGSPADLMTPSYHRRQDEYSLAVNCSANNFIAAFSVEQPPPTIAIAAPASGIGSAPSLARLTWLVRPSESYEYTVNHLPLMAFNIDDACRVATPASASASSASLLDSGDFMVLISAKSCSLIQIVLAVRRESVRARFFLLRNVADRGAGAGPVVAPQDEMGLKIPPALIAFAYAGHVGSPDKLAEELKNRSCTVSVHYRLSVLDNLINKTSVLFVSVSFILLMIISLSWLVFYYVQRFRYLHAKERLSRRLGNAAKKALTMIPVRVLKAGDKDFAWIGDQCAVCIEPYRVSDTVRILPCKHFYHRSCIDPWLLDQRTCPLCKLDILKAVGLALRDRRQRRNRSSDQFSNAGRVSAAAIFGGDSAAVASIVDVAAAAEALEEGAEDFYSMADSVGVISSSGGGGGGGIMSGCLGRGNSARPSIAAASSSDDVDSAAGVVMMTALGGGASIDRQEERGAIMLMPLSSARPDSPSVMDEATEVCYPLVHHYHHHQQQHQQQFNLRRQL